MANAHEEDKNKHATKRDAWLDATLKSLNLRAELAALESELIKKGQLSINDSVAVW